MRFQCKPCKYTTDTKICFQRHLESKKHQEKVSKLKNYKIQESINNSKQSVAGESHICNYCGKQYSTISNLFKHKRKCSEKSDLQKELDQEKEKNKYLEQMNNQYDDQIETLKEEIAYLKTIINGAGNIIKTSVSAMSYVNNHYTDAPALAPIKDYAKVTFDVDTETDNDENDKPTKKKKKTNKELKKNKNEFIEIIVCKYEKNLLEKYLGNIIIKSYKKDDPKKQSLWSSDTSRLTYVVRELLHNKKVDWQVDKKGVKTRNYIVKPLLEYIKDLLKNYIDDNAEVDRYVLDMRDYEPKLLKMNKIIKIMDSIDNGTLSEGILSYITPDLYLSKANTTQVLEE